jgi:uncharacterized membrane protein YiaA
MQLRQHVGAVVTISYRRVCVALLLLAILMLAFRLYNVAVEQAIEDLPDGAPT